MSHPQVRPLRFPNKFRTTGAKNVFPPFESLIHSEGLTSIENYEKSQRHKRYAERSNAGFKGKQVYEQDPRLGKNDDEGLDWLLPTMSGLSSLGGLTGDVLTKIGAQNANLTSEQQKAYVRLARIWDMKQDYDKAQNVLRALAAASEQQGGYPDWWDVLPLVWQQYLIQAQQMVHSGKLKVAPMEAKDKPTKEQVIQQQRQNLEARRDSYEQLQNQVNPLNPIPKDKVKESMPDGAEPLAVSSGNVKNANVLGAPSVLQQQYNDPDNASRLRAVGHNALTGETSKITSIGLKPAAPASFEYRPAKREDIGDLDATLVVELDPSDLHPIDAHHRPVERDEKVKKEYPDGVYALPTAPSYPAPPPPVSDLEPAPALIASSIPVAPIAKTVKKEQVGDFDAALIDQSHDQPATLVTSVPSTEQTEPEIKLEPIDHKSTHRKKLPIMKKRAKYIMESTDFSRYWHAFNMLLGNAGLPPITQEEYANSIAGLILHTPTRRESLEDMPSDFNAVALSKLKKGKRGEDIYPDLTDTIEEGWGEFPLKRRRRF